MKMRSPAFGIGLSYIFTFKQWLFEFRSHGMHEMPTIPIDDPVAWATASLLRARIHGFLLFARWRHFDAAITTLL